MHPQGPPRLHASPLLCVLDRGEWQPQLLLAHPPGPDHRWPWLPHHLLPDEEAVLVCVPGARAGAAQQVLYSLPARYQAWVLERALKDICSLTDVI